MSLPDQTPKLPKLPFVLGDVVLLAVAWFIVWQADGPLSTNAIIAVAACAIVGAVLGSIPFFTDYARKQDEALDDRQRGLDALSRTTTTAAEQISIAANGLNEITEVLHRNLKHAEQLPQKLQEKIAEFNAQLENTREDDREELEKEIAELRASETERLQAIADRIHKSVAELTKLEAAAQKHVAERTELVERANTAVGKAQQDAVRALNDAAAAVSRELTAAPMKVLAEIESKFAAATAAAIASIEAAVAAAAKAAATQAVVPLPPPLPPTASPDTPPAIESGPAELASPPKRPRKSRREEPSAIPAAPEVPLTSADPAEPAAAAAEQPVEPVVEAAAPAEPAAAPVPDEPAASVEPAAPAVPEEPAAPTAPAAETPATAAEPAAPAAAAGEPAPVERPARKRRKPAADSGDLTLELGGGEFSPQNADESDETPVTSSEVVERVISSDGATRLIVTAYIGIGNRLFVRGDGPGLSWDKGVPLQFVSIGKWRWETADATGPVNVKLYKNDDVECAALGTLTLEPGHQEEVTAKF
ncbi:hypothetical protein [Opitutus terrae]|uniref:Uncharacterized protein n=1 Tax=Opitutus terrae (strain DSM 11246 / JCM 15787 / PB90-1) TaxID=452637 RepID=B1ZTN1_OPITP|nr:hypothetical protein [Opitutus terrae]ACB74817.1 hypothetical protein Oter_1533 [Opitutus terrae PB90-1]